MAQGYVLDAPGNVEKLVISDIVLPEVGEEEVLIKHSAIGINYDDIQVRKGVYSFGPYPIIPGAEAVGYVEKAGAKVQNISVGERVAYIMPSTGAYATHRVIHQNYLIRIDSKYPDKLLAAILRKGTVAHYLTRRTFNIKPGHKILVHGATGGVASIICQLAKYFGATVIGVVGTAEKVPYAQKFGCEHVIVSSQEDFVSKTVELTKGENVDVVYDLVGRGNLEKSFEILAPLGLLVHYGDCAGEVESFNTNLLGKKSAFFTRPRIGDYEKNRYETLLSATEILAAVEKKIVKLTFSEYKFQDIPKIHNLMEARKTIGSTIVTF